MNKQTERTTGTELISRIRLELQRIKNANETAREIVIDSASAYELAVLTDAVPVEGQPPSFDGVPLRIVDLQNVQLLAVTKVCTAPIDTAARVALIAHGEIKELHGEIISGIFNLERTRSVLIDSALSKKHLPYIEAAITALINSVKSLEAIQDKE